MLGELLYACIELPQLTDAERSLMREIAHRYALGEHHNWDAADESRVRALFTKVNHVLHPQV